MTPISSSRESDQYPVRKVASS